LARDLVSRTRVAKLLAGYRDRPAADLDAIYATLVRLSQLISDIPEIAELDINPLLANETGVLALDARVRVAPAESSASERLAIRPYPRELEELIEFDGGLITLRPIRPEDEPAHRAFFQELSHEDIHFRFFDLLREPVQTELARFTQIDYEREMAFVAVRSDGEQLEETLGAARAVTDPDNIVAEVAIVIRSDLKGKGLGSVLLKKLIDYCRERGTREIVGRVLPENERMLSLAKKHGFRLASPAGEEALEVRLTIRSD
jgi:acetyltransferase